MSAALTYTMSRLVFSLSTIALASCATAPQTEPSADGGNATTVAIAGCCSFSTTGTVRSSNGAVPTDGFLPVTVDTAEGPVTVSPYLGYYGWLDAENGAMVAIAAGNGRLINTPEGKKFVVALERSSGLKTPLTVAITTDCTRDCRAFEQIIDTFEIERQWSFLSEALTSKPQSSTASRYSCRAASIGLTSSPFS